MFKPLTKNNVTSIVDLLVLDVNKRLADRQIQIALTEEAKLWVVEGGYEPMYGARPLKRFIQSVVEVLVAKTMLSENIKPNMTIEIDEKQGEFFVKTK